MAGRLLKWSGGLIVAAAVVGLVAYLAVAGFRLNDTVGIIGAGVGIAGLALAVCGMAADRRGGTGGKPSTPGKDKAGAANNSAGISGQNNVVNQSSGDQFINQPITFVGGLVGPPHSPPSPQAEAVRRVEKRLQAGDLAGADAELSASAGVLQNGALLWYWKARVALARGKPEVAAHYIDEALDREPRDEPSVALKIKVLLLSPEPDDRVKARTLATDSRGIGTRLDAWLTRLQAEGMFEPGPRTVTELDTKCPYPLIAEDRR